MLDSVDNIKFNSETHLKLYLEVQEDNLKLEFNDCEFHGVQFSEHHFLHHKYHDCRFYNCQLSNIKFRDTTLRSCLFVDSKLIGAQFFKTGQFVQLQFINSILDYISFQNMKMIAWDFSGSRLVETEFYQCDCFKSNFSSCDLAGARFVENNLEQADFSMAKNYFFDLTLNKVKKAKFSSPEVLDLLKTFEIEID